MANYYVYMYLREKSSIHGEAGSPYYVGKGTRYRAIATNHRIRPPKNRAFISYPVKGLSEEEAHAEEVRLIARYGRIDLGTGCLRNWTDGGEGSSGCKRSKETRQRQSKSMRGIPKPPRTPEHCAKMGLHLMGKKQSPELVEKRIAPLRGRTRLPFSEEWKRRISEGKRGNSKPNSGSFKPGFIPWNKGLRKGQ